MAPGPYHATSSHSLTPTHVAMSLSCGFLQPSSSMFSPNFFIKISSPVHDVVSYNIFTAWRTVCPNTFLSFNLCLKNSIIIHTIMFIWTVHDDMTQFPILKQPFSTEHGLNKISYPRGTPFPSTLPSLVSFLPSYGSHPAFGSHLTELYNRKEY